MTAVAPTALEQRVRRAARRLSSADGATWAFRAAVVGAIAVYVVIGRNQWFTRDDWASIITRETVRRQQGWQHWLFDPQDGHWLTVPFLVFGATRRLFGLDSYWPFLVPTLAAHVGSVFLVRALCRRNGVSPWTTTLVCTVLLVFGAGWENLVFAIQVCYNVSLLVFLAQLLLVDHDGPVDRRDALGAGIAVIGVMSSGFGPIFMVGTAILLGLRQRWKALAVAVIPQALAYGWWLVTWSSDAAANQRGGNRSQLPAFVVRGVGSTFEALTSLPGLAGIAVLATIAVALQSSHGRRVQTTMIALCATVVVMFSAIGFQRLGFGVAIASSSRYVHMAAMVVAPAFALAIDQLRRISREARLAGLAMVTIAAGVNVSELRDHSVQWSIASRAEQNTMALMVGSGLVPTADPKRFPFIDSPDVTIGSLQFLVDEGAFTPRVPANEAEWQIAAAALGVPTPAAP
jgi:hypothetical protein